MFYKIKNFKTLTLNEKDELRFKSLKILEKGLEAIDTKSYLQKNISLKRNVLKIKNKKFFLKPKEKICVIAIGKNALEGGYELKKILKNKIKKVLIFVPEHEKKIFDDAKIKKDTNSQILWGTHPFPTVKNFRGSLKLKHTLQELDDNYFIIFLISGGGSTLLSFHPQGEKFIAKEKKLVSELFKKGANIEEINIIRKHLSILRGGGLSYFAYPKRGISLIFSDVPGNKLEIISSGPTLLDKTTKKDAIKIIKKYKLEKIIKESDILETPKDKKFFVNIKNMLFLSNKDALEAMKKECKKLGFKARIVKYDLEGDVKKISEQVWKDALKMPPFSALIYGGESTLKVKGKGKGGRNQELVLNFVNKMLKEKNIKNIIFASLASDGRDNTEFAGALCDENTIIKTKKLKLNPETFLRQNNSFNFFKKVGDYILTGPTGSNVSDIILVLKGQK